MKNNSMEIHEQHCEPWKITLIDTDLSTMIGGRVLRARKYVGNEPFMLTYGDGVSNINIPKLLAFHEKHGKLATLTSVQPEGRYGTFTSNITGQIFDFVGKPKGDWAWINAGFFVLQPEVFDYI